MKEAAPVPRGLSKPTLNSAKSCLRTHEMRLVMSNSNEATISQGQERLADFIRHNHASIVKEWIEFARTRSPASDGMSKLALQDHVVDILKFIAKDIESPQTPAEQVDKSHGLAEGAEP